MEKGTATFFYPAITERKPKKKSQIKTCIDLFGITKEKSQTSIRMNQALSPKSMQHIRINKPQNNIINKIFKGI